MHTSMISILGLAASASAHLTMASPKGWQVNSSPLDPSGSDFPCKGVNYDSSVTPNKMAKGEKQPLSFTGSAVHGGGSCQVSLTTDLEPTKDSVWKVIHSIEGGCPVSGQAGNYGEDPNMRTPGDLGFEIPEDVPAGKYTLAWTWFNKIGNREMYMNCAPAEATGDGGDESSFQALPDMFTANIGNGCETSESFDLEFPSAGDSVERLGDGDLKGPTGSCKSAGGSSGGDSGSGGDSASAPAVGAPGGAYEAAPTSSAPAEAPSAPSGDYEAAPTSSAPAEASSVPSGDYEAAPTSSAPAEASSAPSGDYEAAPASSAPAEASSAPSGDYEAAPTETPEVEAPTTSGGEHAAGEACTTEGGWNCVGGNSFQRCGSGTWSSVQQLASGTTCEAGESDIIKVTRKRGASATRFGAKFLI